MRWTETVTIHVQGQGGRAAREGAGGKGGSFRTAEATGGEFGDGWVGTAPHGPEQSKRMKLGRAIIFA